MAKFTKIRKWATEQGYKVADTYSYGDMPAVLVTIDEENAFHCCVQESQVYYSIHGLTGDRGGLYLRHKRTPKDGRFVRDYGCWYASQKGMIDSMEDTIERYVKEGVR